ncbi:MAG: DUF2442 domain-containing protein [Chloroflexi bacterium]|nr:DUF2442 domain-containing protein [Chloroflexota bacterium]
MNVPRIKSVTPLKGRHLLVTFVNGVQKVYDCQRILNLDRFQLLKHEAFCKAVTVDPGGYGISWDDEMDLSEYELWNNGVEVEQSAAWSKEGTVVQPVDRG